MTESKPISVVPKHSDFIDYIRVLQRRKWLVILCVMGMVLPSVILNQLLSPVYEAEAVILFEEPQDTMFALDVGQQFYSKSSILNLTEQIKSRRIANEVARTLPEKVSKLFKFPHPMREGFSKEKFIARKLQNSLTVVTVRGADILKVKIQANDPEAAKIIADTYVDRILDWNLHNKKEETTNIRRFVEEQLDIFQNNLNVAEDSLRKFKESNKIVSLSESSTEILNRITEVEISYNQAKTDRLALEQRKRFIDQKNRQMLPSFSLTSSPKAQQLKQKLIDLETQYSSNKVKGYNENQSQMIALKEEINELKPEIVQEILKTSQQGNLMDPVSQTRNLLQESIALEVDLETYKAREEALQKILNDYNDELRSLPEQELLLARLIRARDVNDKIYSMLLEKLQEARITEASKIGDVQIVDHAEKPLYPIKPNKLRNLLLAFMLGLGFGVGLALFFESIDTTLKSQEDIEKYLDLTVLALIPSISINGVLSIRKKQHHTKESYVKKLIPDLERKSPIYEAYHSLQINFAFVNADNTIKSIVVTSPSAGEGKTLTAINMALIFSNSGFKTLLIDCDLRHPMIHKILNIKSEPGLTDTLINKVDLDSVIQKIKYMNLNVITCGIIPPNPSELLNTIRMQDLLTELKNKYDIVIVDAPPVIPVTDSVILSNEVDGICLIIKSGKTTYDAAFRAKQLLRNSRAKIIGTILNDVNFKNVYGYYRDYYYYKEDKKKGKKKSRNATFI